jgi:hypothetical protein
VRWCNSWDEVVNPARVREANDHLLDKPVFADRSTDRHNLHIVGINCDEMTGIEAPQLPGANATAHD